MAKAIATVGGVAVAPGVSRNGRLYTRQAIAGMVARVQARLESGNTVPLVDRDDPITGHVVTQLTHHAAEDDSTRIVGRVTEVTLDGQGRARFRAEIANTQAGRDIAALLDTTDGQPPFLRGVSGRMAWLDGARIERGPGGQRCETGDELDLLGLDYTHKPGITDAAVDTFAWTNGGTRTETSERVLIYESVEAVVAHHTEEATPPGGEQARETAAALRHLVIREAAHELVDGFCTTCPVTEAATPMGKRTSGLSGTGGPYADPGYQADKKQRYQLDTKAHAVSAWRFINQAKNAKAYTANQLKRIKGRIKAALKKFGVTPAAEGWVIEPALLVTETGAVTATPEVITEYWAGDSPGSFCLNACNGPINVSVSSYCLDPADLDVILRAAADAACKALAALDPDMDGDIDVPGADAEDTDGDAGETTGDTGSDDPVTETTTEPAPHPAAGDTTERTESAMPETTPAAETTATAAPMFTQADLDAAAARAVAAYDEARRARKAAKLATQPPAETAPPQAPVTETTSGQPAETLEDKVKRLSDEALARQFPQETEDEKIDRLVRENVEARAAQLVASGQIQPNRKGVVKGVEETAGALNEHGLPASWPDKPLHRFTPDELAQYAGPVMVGHVLGSRATQLA